MLVPISSTNTSRFGSICRASVTLQAALSHSSRSNAPTVLFSAEAHPLQEPPQGRFAESLASEALQEVTSVCDGGRRPCAYVLFEKLLGRLLGFRRSSTSLPGAERLSLAGESGVALDRGEADAKESSGLGRGHAALLDGLDYLLA